MSAIQHLNPAQSDMEPVALIGATVRELERELDEAMPPHLRDRWLVEGEFDPAPAIAVWEEFDKHNYRSDYLLWRGAVRSRFRAGNPWFMSRATAFSSRWCDLAHLARITSNNANEEIVWSTIGFAAEISQSTAHAFLPQFMIDLRNRLLSGLRPLPQCPRSCGFAAALFLLEFQHHSYKNGLPLEQGQLASFLGELANYIKWIDPDWRPGKKVNTAKLEVEHNSCNRLQPYHSLVQFEKLISLLRGIRVFLAPTIKKLDAGAEALLATAVDFAYSAWMTAKSLRIDQSQFEQKTISDYDSAQPTKRLQIAEKVEGDCLLELYHALRDAGAWLESAYYLHIHTRIVSDPMTSNPLYKDFQRNKTQNFRIIREAGLEIDERFAGRYRSSQSYERPRVKKVVEALKRLSNRPIDSRNLLPVINWGPNIRTLSKEKGRPREIDRLRLSRDQAVEPDWSIVLNVIPKGASETSSGYLMTVCRAAADHGESAELLSSEILCAVLRLTTRYGLIRSSFKIFKRLLQRDDFVPTSKVLMLLVKTLASCMQIDPLALDTSKVHKWQGLIFSGWKKIQISNPVNISPLDRLQLHEMLMGRATVNRRNASPKTAELLFEKSLSVHSLQGLRELYLKNLNFRRRGARLVQPSTLAVFANNFNETELGPPSFVSVLRQGDCFSVVIVNPDGHVVVPENEVNIPSFAREAAKFQRRQDEWFIDRDADFSQQVIWPDSFLQLAGHILDCLKKNRSPLGSIILAVSPELTAFPLQHLFSCLENTAISLVPCVGWAPLRRYEEMAYRRALTFSISCVGDEALETGGPIIKKQLEDASALPINARVLFGHGDHQNTNGIPLPRIRIGSGSISSLDAWSSALRRRIVVVHACRSGRQKTTFPRDFGGLPGVALGLGCRGLFAPITDVSPDVAEVLNRHLFAANGPDQIGSRYLAAISELPAVCLYNLYGIANESIFLERPVAEKYRDPKVRIFQ